MPTSLHQLLRGARASLAALLTVLSAAASGSATLAAAPASWHASSDVSIEGAPSGLLDDLEAAAAPYVKRFNTANRAVYLYDAAYELELLLRERGFAVAEVSYAVEGDTARLQVHAGPRSTLGPVAVTVDPGCSLTEEQLARYVSGPRTGMLGRGEVLYVQRRVEGSPRRVVMDLVALGHLEATASVDDPGPTPAGGEVRVRLMVNAGPRYRLKPVEIIGEEGLDLEVQFAIREAQIDITPTSPDQDLPYEPRIPGRVRSTVLDALASHGYLDADVRVEEDVDRESHLVQMDIHVEPGPQVTISEVRFESSGRTKERFLKSRLQLAAGDEFSTREVRASVRALYRTGLFSEVRSRVEGEGEQRVLVVELEEQESREVYFEPGFGSYELFRGTVGARDRNLFRSGIDGSAEVMVAVRAVRTSLRLSDPWFLNEQLIGDVQVDFERREEPSFLRENRGAGAFLTKEWSGVMATTLGYHFGRSQAKDVQVVDDDVEDAQSIVNIAGIILSQRYDDRDALFAPTRGGFANASVELAAEGLGSELEFIRGKLSSSWFRRLTPQTVLGLNLRAGLIAPAYDEESIPIQERFFAGGGNSVRSFKESELGPKDVNGEPLGGEVFSTASAELRYELMGALQTAAFVDAGFVEREASDIFDVDNVRLGVGVGLRYLLPIGPLRLDGAVNPDPRQGEDDWVIHFSIGMPF
ncbi:MAG: BamA/TamA family outer membrane protein [Planctomycetota bacterium]|nr:BamA/TamA family outer membrane protein [Planctomycetota bacterium]MDG1984206.1 BamA/TamA family outer membrane protein [Planctomycetota bacterium]